MKLKCDGVRNEEINKLKWRKNVNFYFFNDYYIKGITF